MGARIHYATGAWQEVEEYYEDVLRELAAAKDEERPAEFTRASGGIPRPKVSVFPGSVERVEQVNR